MSRVLVTVDRRGIGGLRLDLRMLALGDDGRVTEASSCAAVHVDVDASAETADALLSLAIDHFVAVMKGAGMDVEFWHRLPRAQVGETLAEAWNHGAVFG